MVRRAFRDPSVFWAYIGTKIAVFAVAAIATWPLASWIGPEAWIGLGVFGFLLAILTPANLFTGVLGCGLFCLLNLWMDRRFLPKTLRLPPWLWLLNAVSAFLFVALGLKGYLDDESRWYALGALCGILVFGVAGAYLAGKWFPPRDDDRVKS